jgi:hypothetical protein
LFSYWSSVIETVLCHVESSSEAADSSIVQQNVNLVHKRFAPFPDPPVVNYILELMVQRMPWISAPDDASWKNLQSSLQQNVDKGLRLIKHRMS